MFNPLNLGIPMMIAAIGMSFIPSGSNHVENSGRWVDGCYVYETHENAVFVGEDGGVAYFVTDDGESWGAYVYDSELQDGDSVTLTFENTVTKSEYDYSSEAGIDYGTRMDSHIISID